MAVLRWLGIGLAAIVGVLVVVGVGARFADGPIGILAGGPLRSGELVTERDIDWTFAKDINTIEFALVEPPRSRTVWVVVHDQQLYVPCGFLDVPLWKQWPHEVAADGRAVLRIDGKRYERQAVRVTDPELLPTLGQLVARKYLGGNPSPEGTGSTWFFRFDPRS